MIANREAQESGGLVTLDLHGHTTSYAVYELVPAYIEAAWQRGYEHIRIIHGSPDIRAPWLADALGRGGTKWALRSALNRGHFMERVWYRGSVKHEGLEVDSGAMTLALRPNPSPDPDYPWPDEEEPAYSYEGPWHRRL